MTAVPPAISKITPPEKAQISCGTIEQKPTLICFSHLRWNFVFQRPQHILTRAVKEFEVIFFEEPIYEETCRAHLDVRETDEGVTVVTPMLPRGLCHGECVVTQRRLLNLLIESRKSKIEVAWYYTPMALAFTSHLNFECVVYDCMDELSNFHGAPTTLSTFEAQLFDVADVVFTGGRALYEAKKSLHDNVLCLPSSIDRAHFAKARNGKRRDDPADQKAIPHPRIGFFGVIDERTDLTLLKDMALLRPDFSFVILGPVVKIDPESLPRMPNIHWLGKKDYAELPDYLAHWDAGFMPFAINDATRYISPTKTPEFLAAGLPVVSTPILDVVRTWGKPGLVSIAETAAHMCEELDRALMVDRSLWLQRVDQALATMSWDMTFEAMMSHVENQLPESQVVEIQIGSKLSKSGGAHV